MDKTREELARIIGSRANWTNTREARKKTVIDLETFVQKRAEQSYRKGYEDCAKDRDGADILIAEESK